MPSKEDIRAQIDALEVKYVFWTKKEINYLPQIMVEGEEIRALTSGFYDGRTVLAVCTNRRMLFLDKGMLFGLRQWQMNLDRVQSIDGNYQIFFGSIRVWDGASAVSLTMVLAKTIDPFIKSVRAAIDEFKRISFREVTGTGTGASDVAGQIERLAKLLEAGHLTAHEFEAQKQKLLGG